MVPAAAPGPGEVVFSEKYARLFEKARYKAYYGGRGGGKSHAIAMAIALICANKETRVVCARQFQNSIKDSVKELLEQKIKALGLESIFEFLRTEIVCKKNGSRITFTGLDRNPDSVKSLEGADICWIEEARNVSQKALDLLIPTIRKPGSEIWCSWNPVNPDDPIDEYFRGPFPPEDAIIEEVSFEDNPWFWITEMPAEMELMKKKDKQRYEHIWLGHYDQQVEARIFKNWRIDRIKISDSETPRFGMDFGFQNDPNALIKMYILEEEKIIYIAAEAVAPKLPIDQLPALMGTVSESRLFTIMADSSRPETIDYLNGHGYQVLAAKKGPGSVREGITWLQGYEIVIDPECVVTANEIRLYSWKTEQPSGKILPIPEDEDNHCIDAIRYGSEPVRTGGVKIRRFKMLGRRR